MSNSMIAPQPVWLSVTFAETCGCHVPLRISANNNKRLAISVIHEGIIEPAQYDFAGNGALDTLLVQDNETLTIIVRNDHSEIIACGVFEVSLDLIEQLSAVLNPCLTANLIVDQHPQRLIDNAATRALGAICGSAVTGELVVAEVR